MILGDLDTGERLLTQDEAAERTGLAPASWRRYVATGQAPEPDTYVGRTPVWLESTVDEWEGKR